MGRLLVVRFEPEPQRFVFTEPGSWLDYGRPWRPAREWHVQTCGSRVESVALVERPY